MSSSLAQSMSDRALETNLCSFASWWPPAYDTPQRRRRRLIYDLMPTQVGEPPVLCGQTGEEALDDAENLCAEVADAYGGESVWNPNDSIRLNLENAWDAAVAATDPS
jgi:hypothetical protein